MEDPQHSRTDEYVWRTRYYRRHQKGKYIMVKTCGNNVRRKCLRISQKEKGPLESQERDDWTMLKMI
jgi:hypothetical protein